MNFFFFCCCRKLTQLLRNLQQRELGGAVNQDYLHYAVLTLLSFSLEVNTVFWGTIHSGMSMHLKRLCCFLHYIEALAQCPSTAETNVNHPDLYEDKLPRYKEGEGWLCKTKTGLSPRRQFVFYVKQSQR